MRVMAVTSRYPPDYVGGYELACEDVTERLRARGHEVHVLTSRYSNVGSPASPNGAWVHRLLGFAPLAQSQAERIWTRTGREIRDNDACRDCIRRVRPNVITVWDLWGLLPSLLTTLERTGIPVTYAISSPWALDYASTPHRWQAFWDPSRSQGMWRWLKSLLRSGVGRWVDRASPILPSAPDLRRAFFVSRALRAEYARAGWDCADAPVIYHGIDAARFYPRLNRTGALGGRLLIAGRVVPEKGIHTAIEALRRLVSEHGDAAPSLDIVGPLPDTEYAKHLRQAMVRGHLEGGHVRFHEQVPRSAHAGRLPQPRRVGLPLYLGRALLLDDAGSDGLRASGYRHRHGWEQRNSRARSHRAGIRSR